MDAAWLAAARAAVEWHYEGGRAVDHDDEESAPQDQNNPLRQAGSKRPTGFGELLALPRPHCEPFRRMLAHPSVVRRLLWMVGPGFYSYFRPAGNLLVMNHGNAGAIQHGGWKQPGAYRAWWTQENGTRSTSRGSCTTSTPATAGLAMGRKVNKCRSQFKHA